MISVWSDVAMPNLPLEIIAYILDMADIDTRIKMNRQKRMDKDRLCIPGIRHLIGWENDILEMTLYLPLPGGQKQYVYSINMQTPDQIWEQLVMVQFYPMASMDMLHETFQMR